MELALKHQIARFYTMLLGIYIKNNQLLHLEPLFDVFWFRDVLHSVLFWLYVPLLIIYMRNFAITINTFTASLLMYFGSETYCTRCYFGYMHPYLLYT
jgi:hypothetical protein